MIFIEGIPVGKYFFRGYPIQRKSLVRFMVNWYLMITLQYRQKTSCVSGTINFFQYVVVMSQSFANLFDMQKVMQAAFLSNLSKHSGLNILSFIDPAGEKTEETIGVSVDSVFLSHRVKDNRTAAIAALFIRPFGAKFQNFHKP